jgi:hypothetical protein
MTMEDAEGTTETAACRFWIVSWTVTRRPFQSPVALAMSSPTFLGDCAVMWSARCFVRCPTAFRRSSPDRIQSFILLLPFRSVSRRVPPLCPFPPSVHDIHPSSSYYCHATLTRPKGPILGAKAAEDPTSPPVARRKMIYHTQSRQPSSLVLSSLHTLTSVGSILGAISVTQTPSTPILQSSRRYGLTCKIVSCRWVRGAARRTQLAGIENRSMSPSPSPSSPSPLA